MGRFSKLNPTSEYEGSFTHCEVVYLIIHQNFNGPFCFKRNSKANGRNVKSIFLLTDIYGSLWYHPWPYVLFSHLNQNQIAKFVIWHSVNEFWDWENNSIMIYENLDQIIIREYCSLRPSSPVPCPLLETPWYGGADIIYTDILGLRLLMKSGKHLINDRYVKKWCFSWMVL